jgi:hypothetical protein
VTTPQYVRIYNAYAAAFDDRDLLFNESFVGISFRNNRPDLARALTAIMNSSFVAYQLAFIACTLGIKQTKVERVDLNNLWIPRLDQLESDLLDELVSIERDLTIAPTPIRLARLDALVCRACGLLESEKALLGDAVARARSVIFETPDDRLPMDAAPSDREIPAYAANLCAAFNEFAKEDDDLALVPKCYSYAANDLIALRFSLTSRSKFVAAAIQPATLEEVAPVALSAAFGGPDLPYLKALQSLRLYVGDALIVVKPARYRCFSLAAAWSDGDRVLADIMRSDPHIVTGAYANGHEFAIMVGLERAGPIDRAVANVDLRLTTVYGADQGLREEGRWRRPNVRESHHPQSGGPHRITIVHGFWPITQAAAAYLS